MTLLTKLNEVIQRQGFKTPANRITEITETNVLAASKLAVKLAREMVTINCLNTQYFISMLKNN